MKEWEEVDRSYDMWAGAISLFEARAQDRSRSIRYERMIEWKERPLSLDQANEGPAIYFANNCISRLQQEPFGASEAWTDRRGPDPWVDQLLLSCMVRSPSFKVPLSATLREMLQLLPGRALPS